MCKASVIKLDMSFLGIQSRLGGLMLGKARCLSRGGASVGTVHAALAESGISCNSSQHSVAEARTLLALPSAGVHLLPSPTPGPL